MRKLGQREDKGWNSDLLIYNLIAKLIIFKLVVSLKIINLSLVPRFLEAIKIVKLATCSFALSRSAQISLYVSNDFNW